MNTILEKTITHLKKAYRQDLINKLKQTTNINMNQENLVKKCKIYLKTAYKR